MALEMRSCQPCIHLVEIGAIYNESVKMSRNNRYCSLTMIPIASLCLRFGSCAENESICVPLEAIDKCWRPRAFLPRSQVWNMASKEVGVRIFLHGNDGPATHMQRKIYKESVKTSIGASVPQAKRTIESEGPFPRPLWLRWMKEATLAGRKVDTKFKETPRTKWKTFEGDESWLFTSMEAIAELTGFDKIQAIVKDGERAGPGWRQLANGSYVFQVPPCEATRTTEEVSEGVSVTKCAIVLTTVTVPKSSNTSPITTAQHPDTVEPDQAPLARWPHLPFYNDYPVYIRSKIKEIILRNEEKELALPEHSAFWRAAVNSDAWWAGEQEENLRMVQERMDAPEDKNKEPRRFQHPLLTEKKCGYMTLRDIREEQEQEQEKAKRGEARQRAKRKRLLDAIDAEEEALEKKLAEWKYSKAKAARNHRETAEYYVSSPMRALPGFQRYDMESDPRFNGGHEAHGYKGFGKDPCDPSDTRSWMSGLNPDWYFPQLQKLRSRRQKIGD